MDPVINKYIKFIYFIYFFFCNFVLSVYTGILKTKLKIKNMIQQINIIYLLCIFQDPKPKRLRLQYDRTNLQRAFDATARGMSVYRAAREFGVPESTLRDRTRGNVTLDTRVGVDTLFSVSEEKQLMDHVKYMASIGYGYNKSGIQYMARDYALSLNKPVKSSDHLSNAWFYDFLKRWPDLKIVKPQKLSLARAKCASKETLANYFRELGTLLTTYNLKDHPERIFNIDETGISTEHSPPKIVCSKDSVAQSVTSPKTFNVTIIAGGNALGNHIPPYYVFPGKRWNSQFLQGAPTGADGEMSPTGWSNSEVFINYLTKHFVKYAGVTDKKSDLKTLVLYDGHKSHASLTLTNWAKDHNVILFVLPPHSSHLTQPLDLGVFGPLKCMYNRECQAYMRNNPGISVTKYAIAELTSKPYVKAMSPENLTSAFKKAGIYPFNSSVISQEQVAPSVIYRETEESDQPANADDSDADSDSTINYSKVTAPVTSHSQLKSCETPNSKTDKEEDFFKKRTITNVVKKPRPKFVPPFLAGSLMKKANVEILSATAKKLVKPVSAKPIIKKTVLQKTPIKTMSGQCKTIKSSKVAPASAKVNFKPMPSTSGLNNNKGAPLELTSEDNSDSDYSDDDREKCCKCGLWEPDAFRECSSILIAKWAQCDFCCHWTHLIYCSEVRVVRRGDIFRCPHCLSKP